MVMDKTRTKNCQILWFQELQEQSPTIKALHATCTGSHRSSGSREYPLGRHPVPHPAMYKTRFTTRQIPRFQTLWKQHLLLFRQ